VDVKGDARREGPPQIFGWKLLPRTKSPIGGGEVRGWRTLPWRPNMEHGHGSGAEDGWDADLGRRWRTLPWRPSGL
jgi:hypothetical protein